MISSRNSSDSAARRCSTSTTHWNWLAGRVLREQRRLHGVAVQAAGPQRAGGTPVRREHSTRNASRATSVQGRCLPAREGEWRRACFACRFRHLSAEFGRNARPSSPDARAGGGTRLAPTFARPPRSRRELVSRAAPEANALAAGTRPARCRRAHWRGCSRSRVSRGQRTASRLRPKRASRAASRPENIAGSSRR